ncbi:MAG: PspC domain-containing protein [Muribaculaceae bacterium]|nr:PspC domain-containing protein [Muribaculaceae bacterium]
MKKTLNINLNGIVFNIDEDAFNMLSDYLDSLRHVFEHNGDDADEIINDIEGRICELLSEKISDERQVVTINHIEEIISRMGHPDEFGDSDYNENNETTDNTDSTTPPPYTVKRKLFRNPKDKIIGGVCSGIAAYLEMDVTWVRLLFVGLGFLTLTTIIVVYLVLLIVVPEAKTAADILAMNGEEQTIHNIGKTVTNAYDNVNRKAQPYIEQAKDGSLFKRIANGIVNVFSFIIKAIVMVLGAVAIPIVLALALAFVVLLLALISFVIGAAYMGDVPFAEMIGINLHELFGAMILCIGVIMSIGIPLVILIFSVFKSSEKFKPLSRNASIVLIVLWVVGLILTSTTVGFLNAF